MGAVGGPVASLCEGCSPGGEVVRGEARRGGCALKSWSSSQRPARAAPREEGNPGGAEFPASDSVWSNSLQTPSGLSFLKCCELLTTKHSASLHPLLLCRCLLCLSMPPQIAA